CYQLATVSGVDPLATLCVVVPCFFVIGVTIQWVFARFRVSPFNSLLVTFGLTVIVESVIQAIWTADFRRLESSYRAIRFRVGPLFVPLPELVPLTLAVALSIALWAMLARTDVGRAMRAAAEDGPIASAFGINRRSLSLLLAGICATLAGVAGVCLAL